MIGLKEHREMIATIRVGKVDEVRKLLSKHKQVKRELCLKQLPVDELSKSEHPYNGERLNAIHYCAMSGSVDIMKELVSNTNKEQLILPASAKKWTPMHFAAFGGHVGMYSYLADCGVDIEARTRDGWSPLNVAISRGNSKLTTALLSKGANNNACLPNGNTPLHVCVDRHDWSEQGRIRTADRVEIIKALSQKGASLHVTNSAGETPLYLCLRNRLGSPGVMTALLALPGASEVVNKTASKPPILHLADNPETIALLIKAGCDVNDQGEDGRTVLHVNSGHSDMVQTLLSLGANPDITDAQGRTALHVSLSRENVKLEVVITLAAAMSNVNAIDNRKNTALHIASAFKYKNLNTTKFRDPLIEALVKAGLMINLQNTKGETALHLALRTKQYTKAGMLVRAGANVDLLDVNGASPRNMDTKWINKVLYQDPLDTRSLSNLSGRSRSKSRSPARSPRDASTAAAADARLGTYLSPNPSPSPSGKLRLSPSNLDQLLSTSEGIDELTHRLGFTTNDENVDQSGPQEDVVNKEARAQLQSQISSLRDEMSCLHDILEGYTLAPCSPPMSVTYTVPSIGSIHEKDVDTMSDDFDLIIPDNIRRMTLS